MAARIGQRENIAEAIELIDDRLTGNYRVTISSDLTGVLNNYA